MKLSIDLDKIELDEYGETVSGIIKDEIKSALAFEVRKAIKENPSLKQAVKKLTDKAAKDLLKQVS